MALLIWPERMASELRRRRVETRRLCEDRRQLLDLTLLQLRDADRLQPKGIALDKLALSALDVRAILETEKTGGDIDLGREEFVHISAAEEDRVELVSEFRLEGAQLSLAAYETLILFLRADGAAGRLPRSFSNLLSPRTMRPAYTAGENTPNEAICSSRRARRRGQRGGNARARFENARRDAPCPWKPARALPSAGAARRPAARRRPCAYPTRMVAGTPSAS